MSSTKPDIKVFRIDGDEVLALPGVANEKLVNYLEDLLQQAKDGEICGVVTAISFPSSVGYIRPAANNCAGWIDSYSMVGALEDAKFKMLQRLNR